MARNIYTHDVAAWKAKDAPDKPTAQQQALAMEADAKAERLLSAGWKSLASWVNAQERDIKFGRREAPQLRPAASSASTATLSLPAGSSAGPLSQRAGDRAAFDAEWQKVESARAEYKQQTSRRRLSGQL